MRVRIGVLAALAAAGLAGCGGGAQSYTLAKTRPCLAKLPHARVSANVDFVASTASGGAVAVFLPRNEVTISFTESEQEAKQIATGYRRVRGRNIGIEDVLRPQGNAVLLWRAHPNEQDSAAISGCLQ
jgi:hypothetical protein